MDSVPIVAITGQVPTPVVGNDAFQEADITGITMPVTKHNFLVKDPADIVATVREAFHIASTGRPGPVLIDLPKDVLIDETTYRWPENVSLPGYKPNTKGNQRQVVEAVKMILRAKQPGALRRRRRDQGRRAHGVVRSRDERAVAGRHDPDGAGRVPRFERALPRHARHARQLHGRDLDAEGRPAGRARIAVRRSRDRQARRVRAAREGDPRRHRPRRDREEPSGRRADRGRLQGRDRQARRRAAHASGRDGRPSRPFRLARRSCASGRTSTRTATRRTTGS